MDYKEAGVDIEAAENLIKDLKIQAEYTHRKEIYKGIGNFCSALSIPNKFKNPYIIQSTDGVGTKLELLIEHGLEEIIGNDVVASNVNDIITSGAEPLTFYDYLSTGKLNKRRIKKIFNEMLKACHKSGCSLVGGETAEMPNIYKNEEFIDIAGFCLGVCEKDNHLPKRISEGDILLGLESNGLHNNGYSLIRKILADNNYSGTERPNELKGKTIIEEILKPTKIYVRPILSALEKDFHIKGMVNITGGGFKNILRVIEYSLIYSFKIKEKNWIKSPIYKWIQNEGELTNREMFNTFNMGIGFVIILESKDINKAIRYFNSWDINAYNIGEIIKKTQDIKEYVIS